MPSALFKRFEVISQPNATAIFAMVFKVMFESSASTFERSQPPASAAILLSPLLLLSPAPRDMRRFRSLQRGRSRRDPRSIRSACSCSARPQRTPSYLKALVAVSTGHEEMIVRKCNERLSLQNRCNDSREMNRNNAMIRKPKS